MTFGPADQLCINTIRTLSIDAIQKANSGHPGLPLGAAPMAYVLWQRHYKHNPKDPAWADRDRFVLSGGHGSMLLYSLLHLTGYDLPMRELERFRQWQSKTPGHPEFGLTPGVEATTGPLGQGSANAVGMAIAERSLANLFNRPGHTIVDHMTYALVTDGDLMEGVNAEAASLAGHLRLGKLVYLYDANDISLDGPTDITFTEDVARRYESYGWQVLRVDQGDTDLDGLDAALHSARRERDRPSMIVVKTTIGFGSPNKAGTSDAHGSPLGPDEVHLTKKTLGWDPEAKFLVPTEAADNFRRALDRGQEAQTAWRERFNAWKNAHPDLARLWDVAQTRGLPEGWDGDIPTFPAGKAVATRVAGGKVLNGLAKKLPHLIGGDADLSCSTKTAIDGGGSFVGSSGAGRNVHFGVREHAMASIAVGMAYHGGVIPYTATFFCFADYMRPAMRLAALNHLPVTFVFTHDSIGLGEDGPTHQPVEHLASLRCMPNMHVVRPADANETAEAWRFAMTHKTGPVSLVLSRQNLPTVDRTSLGPATGLRRGAYVLRDPKSAPAKILLLASGSEVALALEAADALDAEGLPTRVVSMPCWELFAKEPQTYRDEVLPPKLTARLALEAGVSFGWERWVGERGKILAVDKYGASAPAEELFVHYGFSRDNVVQLARSLA